MAELDTGQPPIGGVQSRKEKRKTVKKLKRRQIRREAAIREREEEEARLNDPQEQLRIKLKEEEKAAIAERERKEFEERERIWIKAAEKRREEEEERRRQKVLEESERQKEGHANELEDDDNSDYVEDGPAEIIWKGNEIIVKKKRVKVAKKTAYGKQDDEDVDRPTSNPLPPQSVAFASLSNEKSLTAQELLEGVAQQVPNFGTEQDKAHCPFHLKTGACRFGTRCSRVHFYPDKSCTFLIKNMYSGPGLAWDQDEGLEYTDEEVECCYEDFYEDVHTEFLKFGELVNFKVCKNGSYHLRGNVYVHYKSLESAILAYNTMNGRYFAGKQITCEFVGVTRWKVAICGEYMKSRLKTCSHGTACNFIHCFRNPGGDYEWADWDNPPPKYWIRKMAVLFGHSDESSYGKQMELDDFESPRDSRRKGTLIHGRWHHLKKSPCDEREVPDRKRDRRSSDSRRDRPERRETNLRHKSEQSEGNHESKALVHDINNYPHRHDSSEDRSKRRHREKRQRHEANQKCKSNQRTKEELSTWRTRESSSDKQEKSERKHKLKSSKIPGEGQNLSDQLSGYADDRSKRSTSCSSEEFYFRRRAIDVQDRHDGRYCSNNSDSGKDFSNDNQVIEKIDRYKTRNHDVEHKSNDRYTTDELSDRWEPTVNISDKEETRDHSYNGSSPSYRKARRSDGKCKHRRRKREHEIDSLCSDEESDRWELKYSRIRTPPRCTTSSEKTNSGEQ